MRDTDVTTETHVFVAPVSRWTPHRMRYVVLKRDNTLCLFRHDNTLCLFRHGSCVQKNKAQNVCVAVYPRVRARLRGRVVYYSIR